jgi:hypothetical protein
VTNAENPSPELTTWGVGPWQGEWPLGADGNLDPVLDPELLTGGDSRNVLDKYRYWKMEAIVADLDLKRHKFHVAIENWQHDLNIGSIVRTANAFLAAEVHIIGNKRWNRRGAMVTDRYQHVRHHPTVEDFVAWASSESLPIIAIDNVPCLKSACCYSDRKAPASPMPPLPHLKQSWRSPSSVLPAVSMHRLLRLLQCTPGL